MIPMQQAGITKPLLSDRGRFARTIKANASQPTADHRRVYGLPFVDDNTYRRLGHAATLIGLQGWDC